MMLKMMEMMPMAKEKDSKDILKELKVEEDIMVSDNTKVTFFVNLIYIISLILFCYMAYKGLYIYALPALGLVTLGAFIFNIFIYNESLKTKKRIKAIQSFLPTYENKQTN